MALPVLRDARTRVITPRCINRIFGKESDNLEFREL